MSDYNVTRRVATKITDRFSNTPYYHERIVRMYTVEIEPDASIITTLDQRDEYNDVEVVFADDGTVYIRQYDEHLDAHQLIYMSSQQWLDIYYGYKSPEGSYYVDLKGVSK